MQLPQENQVLDMRYATMFALQIHYIFLSLVYLDIVIKSMVCLCVRVLHSAAVGETEFSFGQGITPQQFINFLQHLSSSGLRLSQVEMQDPPWTGCHSIRANTNKNTLMTNDHFRNGVVHLYVPASANLFFKSKNESPTPSGFFLSILKYLEKV